MPYLTIIAAVAENRAIGYKNSLIYHLSADLKHFKQLTTSHTVLMGRRTFESLPHGALPNRRNIVVSRQKGAAFAGCDNYTSINEALAHCKPDEQVFVIGGASVYEAVCAIADCMELTLIHATPAEADVFFPKIDMSEWREVSREPHEADEHNEKPFDFVRYERKLQR